MPKKPKETFEVIDEEIRFINAPASSLESRENQLINHAINLAEKQLIEGTASSQVIVHYLKLGTQRERIERDILAKQAKLITAKTDSIETAKTTEELYNKAIDAMKSYGPSNG